MKNPAAPADGAPDDANAAGLIESLASRIQALPVEARWLYAQQDIILSIAERTPVVRGRWSGWADRFVRWTGVIGLARPMTAAGTLLLLLFLALRQGRVRHDAPKAKGMFVGLGAMRDPALIRLFSTRRRRELDLVDERDLESFWALQRLPLAVVLTEWTKVWSETWGYLGRSDVEGFDRSFCLSWALTRLHRFVYLRAWFRSRLRASGVAEIGMSAASYVSFAAVAAGARVVYLPHGFQRKSLVFPDFAEVWPFNGVEARHFRTRLPGAAVMPIDSAGPPIETRRVAAIAGDYWSGQDFELCRSFIMWARENRMPVVVRPHPMDETGYWARWRGVDGVDFDDEPSDFGAFLERVRPRLLVTWTSTTLFDAAARGVAPVTLAKADADAADYVIPLTGLGLQWPERREEIAALVEDAERCAAMAIARADGSATESISPPGPRGGATSRSGQAVRT